MSEGLRFAIPVGTPAAQCRSCRAEVYWVLTAAGRRMPVNPDGVSHFATCPNAAKHRKPRSQSSVKGPKA
jgi:hypothetical protein